MSDDDVWASTDADADVARGASSHAVQAAGPADGNAADDAEIDDVEDDLSDDDLDDDDDDDDDDEADEIDFTEERYGRIPGEDDGDV